MLGQAGGGLVEEGSAPSIRPDFTHCLNFCNSFFNILVSTEPSSITPVCSISSQDIGRIGGLAGGQLLSKSFMPGIAKCRHVNDPIFGSAATLNLSCVFPYYSQCRYSRTCQVI
jgi:hypothetical protein